MAKTMSGLQRLVDVFGRQTGRGSTGARVVVSSITDPWWNLAWEETVYRYLDSDKQPHMLFLWQNSPAVVIGRNQNPWTELHESTAVGTPPVPFVRRKSGGGTVYHDLGNLNITFFSAKTHYDPDANASMLTTALQKAGIAASINDRRDTVLEDKKISGSAYKVGGRTAYHHCTLLLRANTGMLRSALRKPANINDHAVFTSKAVASVRSPVANIADFHPHAEVDVVGTALIETYEASPPVAISVGPTEAEHSGSDRCTRVTAVDTTASDFGDLPLRVGATEAHAALTRNHTELRSWDWAYGQTPKFLCKVPAGGITWELSTKGGIITAVESSDGKVAGGVAAVLVGQRFDVVCNGQVGVPAGNQLDRDLLQALVKALPRARLYRTHL